MKQFSAIAVTAFTASLALPVSARSVVVAEEEAAVVLVRAEPANQPHGYTPQVITCPSDTPTIRSASGLGPEESSWLPTRRTETFSAMQDLISRAGISGFDASSYLNKYKNNASALPTVGIAVSGGGYRAMLNGAGVLEAFDSRTPNSTSQGQVGGLLQSATYLAGLSGGSWLVGSLFANNFTTVNSILAQDTANSNSGDLWQLGNSIFEGPNTGGIQLLDTAGYYVELVDQVNGKKNAGFNVTLTDIWGRALSYQFVNASDGGPAYTFSSIAQQEFFTNGSVPLPLIVADSRKPGQQIVSSNSTIFVFDPWEFGSNDANIYGFAPMEYVGTNFTNGSPADTSSCVVGYDNIGYVYGTSSTLFNEALIEVNGTNTTGLFGSILQGLIEDILENVAVADNDIADYPNPFYKYTKNNGSAYVQDIQLTLTDGGEDGQNVPFYPLIQPDRHVDVIFAVDSSADTNSSLPTSGSALNWPAGLAPLATYERSLSVVSNGTGFPEIPGVNTFVNLGLNYRPTFFGCEVNKSSTYPLVVYLPNAPYSYNSNVSTFDLQYSDTERDAIVQNGYNLATQGNSSIDSAWPTCVACAILSRSFNRTGTTVPAACNDCFDRYCWNGTVDNTTPKPYVPASRLGTSFNTSNAANATGQTKKGAAPRGGESAGMAMTVGLAVVLGVMFGL